MKIQVTVVLGMQIEEGRGIWKEHKVSLIVPDGETMDNCMREAEYAVWNRVRNKEKVSFVSARNDVKELPPVSQEGKSGECKECAD